MTQEKPYAISQSMKNILGMFNVNVNWSGEVSEYLESLSPADREALRVEFHDALQKDLIGKDRFRTSTACAAKDEATAHRFFKDVYAYAFEGGEEPYVPDYR